MKSLRIIMMCLIILGIGHSVEAQFLKKMMSSLGNQVDPSELPSTYTFNYRYTVKMIHKKGDFKINYYLKKDADYFGSLTELDNVKAMEGMFMVHDNELNAMTIFMERGDNKTAQVVSSPSEMESETDQSIGDYTITQLPDKQILGYQCKGFKMESEEFDITMYILADAPVSFNNVGQANAQAMPKGFDASWLKKAENSLMMEMHFEHKKKKKLKASMVCVGLEKESKVINVTEYEFPQTEMLKRLNNN